MAAGPGKLALVALPSLLLGALAGAYGARVLYGDPEVVALARPPSGCPDCPACPACPECPVGTAATGTAAAALDPALAGRPGLPVSAFEAADRALQVAVGPCLTSTMAEGVDGTVLLELVVTASAGTGRFHAVQVSRRVGNVEPIEPCVRARLREAAFASPVPEGVGRRVYPLRIPRPL
jgi:hypothetical protein